MPNDDPTAASPADDGPAGDPPAPASLLATIMARQAPTLLTVAEHETWRERFRQRAEEAARQAAEEEAARPARPPLPPPVDIDPDELRRAILARGLPDAVARIAVDGGESVHPALGFRAEAVDLSSEGATVFMRREYGDDTWLPLWQCGAITTVFSLADGSFLRWNAEATESFDTWPDWSGVVEWLCQELWEDETSDDDLAAVRTLLLGPAYPRRTERLLLRPLRADDVDVILAYRNDPEVAEFQDWDLPVTRQRVESHVAAQSGWTDITPGEPRQIGIDLDGELIGDLYVSLDEHGGVAEIGFTLRTEFQGKGYAFEAASELVADLIGRLGCHRIVGQLSPKNVRSARLLDRLGMHVESLAPKSYWCRGAWDDNLVYVMSDEAFSTSTTPVPMPEAR